MIRSLIQREVEPQAWRVTLTPLHQTAGAVVSGRHLAAPATRGVAFREISGLRSLQKAGSQTTPQNIALHIRAIYEDGEISGGAICKSHIQVGGEGARRVRLTRWVFVSVRP